MDFVSTCGLDCVGCTVFKNLGTIHVSDIFKLILWTFKCDRPVSSKNKIKYVFEHNGPSGSNL